MFNGVALLSHRDCVDLLKKTPDESIDLALYDPPYFMGKKPFVNKEKGYARLVADWDNQWETTAEYLEWCGIWLRETARVLKPGGTILVFGSTHTVFDVHLLMRELRPDGEEPYFTFRNFVTWHLTNAPPIFMAKAEGLYARSSQYFNYFVKGKRPAYFDYDYLKELAGGVQHRDWFLLPNEKNTERVGHPSQKPLGFITTLVNAHCPPGGTVMDVFLGSGTTAVAAVMTQRNFVGCDASLEYVIMAEERLRTKLIKSSASIKRMVGTGEDSKDFVLNYHWEVNDGKPVS
jgi:site-specific DNA-methyltransferase (adenine-specific)